MLEKAKVMFLVTKGDMGGAQKYVSQLANGLDKERWETIIVTGTEGTGGAPADYKLKWLTNKWQPFFLFYSDIMAVAELARFFKRERPVVVHLNSSKAGVVGALAAKLVGVPRVIFTAHGWVFADEKLARTRRLFYRWLHKIAAWWQDTVITVSEYDRKLAVHHKVAPEKKLVRIWNGISIKNFQSSLLERHEARTKILNEYPIIKIQDTNKPQIPIYNDQKLEQMDSRFRGNDNKEDNIREEIWVGSIGRLVKEKNYSLLLEAINKLRVYEVESGKEREILHPTEVGVQNDGGEKMNFSAIRQLAEADGNDREWSGNDKLIRCFIIGEGYEEVKLRGEIKRLGLEEEFFIVPPDGRDARLMRAFDVFVLPSRKEGLPYTIIEAFAAGVPVIVSRVGGMTELVQGERGWIFEPDNAEELAEKIGEVLENKEERERRAEAARKFAEEELTVEKMIAAVERVYRS